MKRPAITLCFLAMLPVLAMSQQSTWQTIQSEILNKNCITCHQEGTSFAVQSGLILTEDVAYQNLIDIVPKNAAAQNDGLVRVSAEGTVAAPHKSFLWEKINAPNQNHLFQDHAGYGSLMPLGDQPLTNGQISFITNWIEAGAPSTGSVVDIAVLDDTSRYVEKDFRRLDRPQNGMQFHLGPFDVWSSERWDREFLYFWPEPTTEDLYVKSYEISMRQGSHHFIIYNYPEEVPTPPAHQYRDMRDANGINNLPNLFVLGNLFPFRLFVGTQVPYTKYTFPEGIALKLPAGSGFDLNSHSVNRSGQTQLGEVYTNLYFVDRSEVDKVAQYDNFGNYDINLPPQKVTTVIHEGFFSEKRHIIQMWSHSHEHTVEFSIERIGGENDGELIYWTNDWEHPPFLQFDPPLEMAQDQGLRLITTYDNQTNRTIRFGPLSTDEMQFAFYLYYTESSSDVDDPEVPEIFSLEQNFPNPFNPGTTIRYTLANPAQVTLKVYNTLGQEVQTLVDEFQDVIPNPTHEVDFDGSGFPNGIYFYELSVDGKAEIRKMLLLK